MLAARTADTWAPPSPHTERGPTQPASAPLSIPVWRPVNSIRQAGDEGHAADVVDAEDIGAGADAEGDSGGGALDALVDGQVKGEADDRLARSAQQERPAERAQFVEASE